MKERNCLGVFLQGSGGELPVKFGSAQFSEVADLLVRVVDLGGRFVAPGLADGHLHGVSGGPGIDLAETRSLDELLIRHHIDDLDLLQIDAEGYDLEIIAMIDFNTTRPRFINYERVLLQESERFCEMGGRQRREI